MSAVIPRSSDEVLYAVALFPRRLTFTDEPDVYIVDGELRIGDIFGVGEFGYSVTEIVSRLSADDDSPERTKVKLFKYSGSVAQVAIVASIPDPVMFNTPMHVLERRADEARRKEEGL